MRSEILTIKTNFYYREHETRQFSGLQNPEENDHFKKWKKKTLPEESSLQHKTASSFIDLSPYRQKHSKRLFLDQFQEEKRELSKRHIVS